MAKLSATSALILKFRRRLARIRKSWTQRAKLRVRTDLRRIKRGLAPLSRNRPHLKERLEFASERLGSRRDPKSFGGLGRKPSMDITEVRGYNRLTGNAKLRRRPAKKPLPRGVSAAEHKEMLARNIFAPPHIKALRARLDDFKDRKAPWKKTTHGQLDLFRKYLRRRKREGCGAA